MAITLKEQLNVQVTSLVRDLAKTCASAHQMSLNAWVANAIQAQIAKDRETFRLDEMNQALRKIAEKYLPGKVATEAQMLAMANRVAAEDTAEGFAVTRIEASASPQTQSRRSKLR